MTLRSPFRMPRKPSRKSRFDRLWRGDRGAVAVLFLFGSVAVLATSLGAMDLVRHNVVQGKLQHALDGATLSAGRNLGNLTPTPGTVAADQWQQDAFQYFNSNMPAGFLGSSIKPEDLKINYTEETTSTGTGNYVTGQVISMDARGILPLISVGFLNVATFNIQASNQAVRRMRQDLELVMALDNTGSMAGSKISTLKSAAKDLAAIVLGAATASGVPGRVYIGLVPFADTVNVGNTVVTRQWLTYPAAQTYFINNYWKGCIVEPKDWGGNNLPAAVLSPTAGFQPLHLTLRNNISNLGLASSGKNYERIASNTTNVIQPRAFNANIASSDRRVWARRSNDTSFDVYAAANPTNCQDSRLTRFLNDDLNTLNGAIDAMQAQGNTLIPTGLLWAWRMLSPAWRPGWGDPDKPRDADPQNLRKAIVLLTDGMNEPSTNTQAYVSSERSFSFKLTYDVQQCSDKNFKTCNANLVSRTYTQAQFNQSTSTEQLPMNSLKMRDPFDTSTSNSTNQAIGWGSTSNISTTTVDSYLRQLCTNVKNDGNGIKIYTVTLGNVGSSTETLMNNCSSGAGYYYNTNNVSDLPDVFRSIAGALVELRLTK